MNGSSEPTAFHLELLARIATETRVTADGYQHAPLEGPVPAFGPRPAGPLPPKNEPDAPPQLVHFLYARYHLNDPLEQERSRRAEPEQIPIVLREEPRLGAELRAAHHGRGYADPGWRVVRREGDAVVVTKNDLSLLAGEQDLVGRRSLPAPGTVVSLRFPSDRPYANPGFYTVVGNEGPAMPETRRTMARVYFNIRASGAAALLSTLTGRLSQARVRFSFKVLNHPDAFTRPDSAVLYLYRHEFSRARRVLATVAETLRAHLAPGFPAFARPIATGISVAEEPELDEPARLSFGQHRAQLAAFGLTRAFHAGQDTPEQRYHAVLREFEAAGLDPSRPYLNAGSTDVYDLTGTPGELLARATATLRHWASAVLPLPLPRRD
ncbi:T3SS effector HopA1 family protein [Archangium sp.]|uniref:T3SS effector HopA1 family protein n=1 Tax=Archangium sp. TaxID=1872627 RepID=UPI002D4F6E98|nr:T3SS effector HopA1 family protein [Archangium sp.]HYO51408.1 T3SS effector HopA1 family protein [Archangium sp.]